MAIYVIPDWLLVFLPALAFLAFWYHSITLLSATYAANVPKKGYCSFLVESWALLASVQIASFSLAYALGVSVASDPLLLATFLGSALLSFPLLLFAFSCITSH